MIITYIRRAAQSAGAREQKWNLLPGTNQNVAGTIGKESKRKNKKVFFFGNSCFRVLPNSRDFQWSVFFSDVFQIFPNHTHQKSCQNTHSFSIRKNISLIYTILLVFSHPQVLNFRQFHSIFTIFLSKFVILVELYDFF